MPDPDNVVEFTPATEQLWAPYERMLREAYIRRGVPLRSIDAMVATLKPVYMDHVRRANRHPLAKAGVGDPLSQMQHWVSQLVMSLLMEIGARESRLAGLVR